MIRHLRRRFILYAVLAVGMIIVILIGALNILSYISYNDQVNYMLSYIAQNNGEIPFKKDRPAFKPDRKPEEEYSGGDGQSDFRPAEYGESSGFFGHGMNIDAETQFRTRYFTCFIDQNGNRKVNVTHIASVDAVTAEQYIEQVLLSDKLKGEADSIYRYEIFDSPDGRMIVFLLVQAEKHNLYTLGTGSAILGGVVLVLVVIAAALFSKAAVRPFAENAEKQKRFITDAGHEIKTPVAVISANADVLLMSGQDNQWVRNIKHQTERLTTLTNDLVALSRLDEEDIKLTLSEVDLSDMVENAALDFSVPAELKGKSISENIAPDIKIKGNEGNLTRVISILLDNAIKYSSDGARIGVTLEKRGNKAILSVSNPCDNLTDNDVKHLFDRFYRADGSRSRETGGSGIGLALCKAIAEAHGGKVTAEAPDLKIITFRVELPG